MFNSSDQQRDSDGDGLSDGYEDSNGNGIQDGNEDRDFDGLTDGDEIRNDTNPFESDTDGDGLLDGFEFFSRNSQGTWLNPLDATGIHGGQGDPDEDGFTNLEEQDLA